MPKILVLFPGGAAGETAQIARTVVEGAESVRFTEVELRTLDAGERVADHDGVVFVLPDEDASAATRALAGRLADKVGAVVTSGASDAEPPLVAAMLGAGLIVVGSGPERDARALGARVAKVTEWIRHAKSHEHSHHH